MSQKVCCHKQNSTNSSIMSRIQSFRRISEQSPSLTSRRALLLGFFPKLAINALGCVRYENLLIADRKFASLSLICTQLGPFSAPTGPTVSSGPKTNSTCDAYGSTPYQCFDAAGDAFACCSSPVSCPGDCWDRTGHLSKETSAYSLAFETTPL